MMVRPNKLKHQSLEQRKLYCRAKQGEWVTHTQNPWTYWWFPVAQSCLTLYNPMDYSPPGSSIHGILQARILEWVAISSSRGSSQPRDRTQVSCIAGGFFTSWGAAIAILRWWGSKMLYLGHRGRGCVSSRWRGISITIYPSIFAESLVFYCCRPNYH